MSIDQSERLMPETSVVLENTPGLLNKLHLGQLAMINVSIELAGAGASVMLGDLAPTYVATACDMLMDGGALLGARQYFTHNRPKSRQLLAFFIKDKSTE